MTDTTEQCWLIITSCGKRRVVAKQFGLDPRQSVVKLPTNTIVIKLGPKASALTLTELVYRYKQGIDFELTLKWTDRSVAPGGFEELN